MVPLNSSASNPPPSSPGLSEWTSSAHSHHPQPSAPLSALRHLPPPLLLPVSIHHLLPAGFQPQPVPDVAEIVLDGHRPAQGKGPIIVDHLGLHFLKRGARALLRTDVRGGGQQPPRLPGVFQAARHKPHPRQRGRVGCADGITRLCNTSL